MNEWKVGQVENFSFLFSRQRNLRVQSFNEALDKWDMSRATDLWGMFEGASLFNQPVEAWDVSRVTDMDSLFEVGNLLQSASGGVECFQGLNPCRYSLWDAVSLISLSTIGTLVPSQSWKIPLTPATRFNQSLTHWNVSRVTTLGATFAGTLSFDQPLDEWDTSNVLSLEATFQGASAFNQDLSAWDVSNVETMSTTFALAGKFDQDLSSWDVAKVTDMSYMFAWGSTV